MALAEVPPPHDDKYITFKLDDFMTWVSHGVADDEEKFKLAFNDAVLLSLDDAVVIRRQDYFASPALATYAAMIAITIKLIDDPDRRAQLLAIADYFTRQSELAADEGWKYPDL
jgi:hypothetical protein